MNRILLFASLHLVLACSRPTSEQHESPSHVEGAVHESDLPLVRLTAKANETLDVKTSIVEERTVPGGRLLGGEVIIPPGRSLTITAPTAGVVRGLGELAPGSLVEKGQALLRVVAIAPVTRNAGAQATRDVDSAEATLKAAEARLTRTEQLLRDNVTSQRALEEAQSARDVAAAEVEAARANARRVKSSPLLSEDAMLVTAPEGGIIRSISVGSGQVLHAGAPLLEIVAVDALWVRVPIQSGDLGRLDLKSPATVQDLGRTGAVAIPCPATPGPPTADPLAGTVDHYCALSGTSDSLRPGARVLVDVPLRDQAPHLVVPNSSIFFDPTGSSWVYTCDEALTFRRSRVELLRQDGQLAILTAGPQAGTCVVSQGTAEIYGAEFPPGH